MIANGEEVIRLMLIMAKLLRGNWDQKFLAETIKENAMGDLTGTVSKFYCIFIDLPPCER